MHITLVILNIEILKSFGKAENSNKTEPLIHTKSGFSFFSILLLRCFILYIDIERGIQ